MTPEELKARARRIPQELLTQGDLAAIAEVFAPDCRHHAPVPMNPGIAGARQWIVALRRAFPDLRASIEDELADGSMVAQRLVLAGTHQGTWLEVPASGRRVTWHAVVILHADPDGVFIDHWSIWDQLDLLRQIVPATAERGERPGA